MLKSTALLAMVGLFLAVTLIWTVPGFAQAQGGDYGRSYGQGYGPCGGGAGPGYCVNPQTGSQYGTGYGPGYCYRNRGKNQARVNNNLQTPANPNPEPQSQIPGGGPAPQSGN